jgi:15-cis-phytoene synthase
VIDRQSSVRDAARSWAPDHYIAALLAPADQRDDLLTLAAFWGETRRIATTVGEDMLGEIRLQWWRDALTAGAPPSGHPTADALQEVMVRRQLDLATIESLLDARSEELRRLPFDDEAAFDTYLMRADGGLLNLGARVRGILQDGLAKDVVDAAARGLGRVRVALDLPYFAAKARLPLWDGATGAAGPDGDAAEEANRALAELARGARSALAEVLQLTDGADRRLIDAVLPVALLEPYLRALETKGRDPLRDVAVISPLSRVTRLTWAHVRGRL